MAKITFSSGVVATEIGVVRKKKKSIKLDSKLVERPSPFSFVANRITNRILYGQFAAKLTSLFDTIKDGFQFAFVHPQTVFFATVDCDTLFH